MSKGRNEMTSRDKSYLEKLSKNPEVFEEQINQRFENIMENSNTLSYLNEIKLLTYLEYHYAINFIGKEKTKNLEKKIYWLRSLLNDRLKLYSTTDFIERINKNIDASIKY